MKCSCCYDEIGEDDPQYTTSSGFTLCEECFCREYFTCESCNEIYSIAEEHNYNGLALCDSCYENERQSDSIIYDYHEFDPNNYDKKYSIKGDHDSLYLGFELEMGGCDDERDVIDACETAKNMCTDLHFHFEQDGSIPDYGAEMISQPMTLAYHKQFIWDRILKHFIKAGLRSHNIDDCGLHVHVNRDYYTKTKEGELKWAKLDLFVQTNKHFMETIARRSDNYYARYDSEFNTNYVVKGKDVKKCGKYGGSRYRAVNFSNTETVEFRLFKGTLKYSTFIATLQFVHALVNWSMNTSVNVFLNNKISLLLFLNYIRENRRIYEELNQYISERYPNSVTFNKEQTTKSDDYKLNKIKKVVK